MNGSKGRYQNMRKKSPRQDHQAEHQLKEGESILEKRDAEIVGLG